MTFDEMQGTMEFMLQHGAQLDARLETLSESVKGLREQFQESHATLTASLMRLIELMQESDRRNDERFRAVDERFIALADAQRSTDERLNAVIGMVEKHLTGPDHGRSVPQ